MGGRKNLTAGNFRTFRHFLVCFYQFSFILHAAIVVLAVVPAAFWLGFMRLPGEQGEEERSKWLGGSGR